MYHRVKTIKIKHGTILMGVQFPLPHLVFPFEWCSLCNQLLYLHAELLSLRVELLYLRMQLFLF